MAVAYISEKLNMVRSHLAASIVLCCSGMLILLIPTVHDIFIYFWPLLVSTALCAVALLSVRSYTHSSEDHGSHAKHMNYENYNRDESIPVQANEEEDHHEKFGTDNENISFIECVKQLHECGSVLFESMFKLEVPRQSNDETSLVSKEPGANAHEEEETVSS